MDDAARLVKVVMLVLGITHFAFLDLLVVLVFILMGQVVEYRENFCWRYRLNRNIPA